MVKCIYLKNIIELRQLTMTIDSAIFAADSPVEALPTDGLQHRGVRPMEQVFLRYRQAIILVNHLCPFTDKQRKQRSLVYLTDKHKNRQRWTSTLTSYMKNLYGTLVHVIQIQDSHCSFHSSFLYYTSELNVIKMEAIAYLKFIKNYGPKERQTI